eukprot:9410254-Pyramimonas_sp.AAC.1
MPSCFHDRVWSDTQVRLPPTLKNVFLLQHAGGSDGQPGVQRVRGGADHAPLRVRDAAEEAQGGGGVHILRRRHDARPFQRHVRLQQ